MNSPTFADYIDAINRQWGVNIEALAAHLYKLAVGETDKGDRRSIEYIFNRLLGKPLEQIDINANIVTSQIVGDIIKRINSGEIIELEAVPLLLPKP